MNTKGYFYPFEASAAKAGTLTCFARNQKVLFNIGEVFELGGRTYKITRREHSYHTVHITVADIVGMGFRKTIGKLTKQSFSAFWKMENGERRMSYMYRVVEV